MKKLIFLIKIALNNKNQWLIPAIVILIFYLIIHFFLSVEGFRPFGYKIF
jgi:hypothetical protein